MAQFSGRKLYVQIAKTRKRFLCRIHNFNIYQKPTTKSTKLHKAARKSDNALL